MKESNVKMNTKHMLLLGFLLSKTYLCADDTPLNAGIVYYSDLLSNSADMCIESMANDICSLEDIDLAEEKKDNSIEIPNHLLPGCAYYETLLSNAQQVHWITRLTFHSSVASKGFNDRSLKSPLSDVIFGREVLLKDIYLLSRLADDNKLRIDNQPARQPVRPQTSRLGFGSYESDEYIALLANSRLNANAETREFGINISTAYKFYLGKYKRVFSIIGLIVPVKTVVNILNLNVDEGTLFTQQFAPFGVVRETPLTQFSRDFTGLFDFFERGILKPKNITFKGRQREIGFGDITLFGLLDFACYFNKFKSLQVGCNLIFPSGYLGNQNTLFPVSLGSGALQYEFFANIIFESRARMFNPALHVVGNIERVHAINQRIPQRIVFNGPRQRIDQISLTTQLSPPPTFMQYYVDPFDEFDTNVPAFANTAFPVKMNRANRVLFGFGNYAYNIFSLGLQLAIFYDIMHKDGDSFSLDNSHCNCIALDVDPSNIDFEAVKITTKERSHTISWTLSYQFKNLFELNVGSQHVIAGKNVARTHEVYMSFIAVF